LAISLWLFIFVYSHFAIRLWLFGFGYSLLAIRLWLFTFGVILSLILVALVFGFIITRTLRQKVKEKTSEVPDVLEKPKKSRTKKGVN
jgi:hypothetical protein